MPIGSSRMAMSCTNMYAIVRPMMCENSAIHWCVSGG